MSLRASNRLGCLVMTLVLVTVTYFGYNIGEVYLRYFRMKDAMEQEVRFANSRDDNTIRVHLSAVADSIGLPHDAGRVVILRQANRVSISSSWAELVELPLFVREFRFAPQVVRAF
jgi:hypothetical protein